MVQGPLFDVPQLRSYLTTNLGTSLCFSSLCGCVMSMRGFRGYKPRKASFGLRSAATAAMEPTPAIALGPRTLAQSASPGPGLAPLTLPVWAIKPWFGISFHCAHISSVYGVLLYPILDGFARHAWLGPRTADQAKLSCATCAQVTLKAETWVGALLSVDRGS